MVLRENLRLLREPITRNLPPRQEDANAAPSWNGQFDLHNLDKGSYAECTLKTEQTSASDESDESDLSFGEGLGFSDLSVRFDNVTVENAESSHLSIGNELVTMTSEHLDTDSQVEEHSHSSMGGNWRGGNFCQESANVNLLGDEEESTADIRAVLKDEELKRMIDSVSDLEHDLLPNLSIARSCSSSSGATDSQCSTSVHARKSARSCRKKLEEDDGLEEEMEKLSEAENVLRKELSEVFFVPISTESVTDGGEQKVTICRENGQQQRKHMPFWEHVLDTIQRQCCVEGGLCFSSQKYELNQHEKKPAN